MADERYEYWLQASGGGTKAILKILDNGQVECQFGWSGMGTPFQYLLLGKCEPLSETYGLIRIHRVEDMLQPSASPLPIQLLGRELIYEYVKLPQNPSWRHPEDALWINGRWNDSFELILLTSDFVLECFDALKFSITEGTAEQIEPPELVEYLTDASIEQLEYLTVGLDKRKFAKVEGHPTTP